MPATTSDLEPLADVAFGCGVSYWALLNALFQRRVRGERRERKWFAHRGDAERWAKARAKRARQPEPAA